MKSILLSVMIICAGTLKVWAETAPPFVSVTGEGTVTVVPDMAVISLGVAHQGKTAKAAMDAVSADARTLLARLTELGVAARDVQTDRLSVSPVWEQVDNARRVVGFAASTSVSVRLRDLDNLGSVLDGALVAGANTFNGLRFDLAERREAEAHVREAAVRDAIARATQMAEAANLALGPVRSMVEQGNGGAPQMMSMARSGGVPVAVGELSVSTRVSVTFDLAQ
ncbi:SIMPL domain-containing protein [uncultured Tateyamaria sp.]|uniref:SIMPL domain-containing protein n=1 Tax=uncultured Tateyamaria sp. TaxID=455651 RepID=UPI002615FF48|nr:SIMPL domain-containing protein [uncultured Tateyamaria sp.]